MPFHQMQMASMIYGFQSLHQHNCSRLGEQVYSCTSSCKGWDGKMNDQAVNPGVYVYHLVYRDERGDRKELNGEFTLLR
jgi:gliding motility-associated-like protein